MSDIVHRMLVDTHDVHTMVRLENHTHIVTEDNTIGSPITQSSFAVASGMLGDSVSVMGLACPLGCRRNDEHVCHHS